MIYFIITFTILGITSLILAIIFLTINHFQLTKSTKRATLIAVVWLIFAASLYTLTRNNTADFLQGLPQTILNLDIRRPNFGPSAINELLRRAQNSQTNRSDWKITTDILLTHRWWLDYPQNKTSTRNYTSANPVRKWFNHLLQSEALTTEEFRSWLTIDPPPIFHAPDWVETNGNALSIYAKYGRTWNAETKIPYEISNLTINNITINDEKVDFQLTPAPDSDINKGRYAQTVVWFINNLPQPKQPGRLTIKITYHLSAEPGRFTNIGPLTWRKTIEIKQ